MKEAETIFYTFKLLKKYERNDESRYANMLRGEFREDESAHLSTVCYKTGEIFIEQYPADFKLNSLNIVIWSYHVSTPEEVQFYNKVRKLDLI